MGSVKLYKSLKNESQGNLPIVFITDREVIPSLATPTLFQVRSSINQNLTIDWGDGTTNTYSLPSNNTFSIPQKTYLSPFGLGVDKTVTLMFQDNLNVTLIWFRNLGIKGSAPSNIETLTNLTEILFIGRFNDGENRMTTFPLGILNINSLNSIYFEIIFDNTTIFDGKIPDGIFNKPMINLQYTEGLTNDFVASNISKIYLLKNTLQFLRLGNVTNRNNFSQLPDDAVYGFQNLTNLLTLSVNSGGNFSSVPSIVNQITSLKNLDFGNVSLLTYGDFPDLINLTFLNIASNTNLTTSIPIWFNNLISLKEIQAFDTFRNQSRIDAFIDSFYSFITTYALIVGISSDPFRSMNINIGTTGAVGSPTGIFQQPAGYIQGSSNGTPASSKEKIWVLVNQYSHVITYS